MTTVPPTARAHERHALRGFGRSVGAAARVRRAHDEAEVLAVLRSARESGGQLCLRGAGRSYGDAAFTQGDVLDLTSLREVHVDPDAGTVTAGAGATIEDLWRAGLPHGLWPAVVPGTMHATVGGCLAMNVHGKNQFRDGSIGEHVVALRLAGPDGALRELVTGRDDELLRAVIGGLGMLGVVTQATLRMRRVASGEVVVQPRHTASLAEAFDVITELAADNDYVVAWVDAFSRHGATVAHGSRHLRVAEDPHPGRSLDPSAQDLPPRILGWIPTAHASILARPMARPSGVRLVNVARRALAALRGEQAFIERLVPFSFLLDRVPGWRDLYGAGGLLQHQSLVPEPAAREVFPQLLALCREADLVPWLAVLKRHRPDEFLLTHNLDGWSLALDFCVTPDHRERLYALCRRLDDVVLGAGGCFHPAKDQTATPASFERAFPGLPRFREWKRRLDPDDVLTSALWARLGADTPSS